MKASTVDLEATPETPWLGLRSFTESSAAYFFGRSLELTDLQERVVHKPLTVLFGQSGWGKTSLIQAGLVPRLRAEGYLPVGVRLVHEGTAPSLEKQMLRRLIDALRAAGFQDEAESIAGTLGRDDAPSLWLLFHDPRYGFVGPRASALPSPVFIIDQFEEIFTLGARVDRRDASSAFRDALAALVENRPPASLRALIESDEDLADRIVYQAQKCRVLLSLRYDFLHLLERWRRQMPSVMDNRMELRLLGGLQAFDAVVRPGQMRAGPPPIIPDDVGRAIVRFVSGAEPEIELKDIDAVPPLLSLVCAELNAQRIAANAPQISQAQFEGNSAEILESFYTRSFEAVTYGEERAAVPEFARALLCLRGIVEERLLSADGFRESVALDTIQRELLELVPAAVARQALEALVERRLLTVEERGGVQRMELTHDVLTRIAKASRDQRQETEALERARQDREHAEREAEAIRRQRNRLRRWTVAAAACAIVAVIGATLGWRGMVRAREAAAEARTQQAEALAGYQAARDSTDKMLARIADPDMGYVPGIQPLREEMARRALAQYAAMLAKHPDDASLLMGLLRAQSSEAAILEQIGALDEAVKADEDLIKALHAARKKAPSPDLEFLIADASLRYDHFIENGDLPKQPALLDEVIRICEAEQKGENQRTATYHLARAYSALGNWASDPEEKIRDFSKGREIASPLVGSNTENADYYNILFVTTHNLGREDSFSLKEDIRKKGRELMEEADRLQEKALALKPDSPDLLKNRSLGLQERAVELATAGDFKGAQASFDQAINWERTTIAANPRVTEYRAYLAYTLKEYAGLLARVQDYAKAREIYGEAIGLLEPLLAQRDMRPAYGAWLLVIAEAKAEFEYYGRGSSGANKGDPALAATTRTKFIEIGRALIRKYPEASALAYCLGQLLSNHGLALEDRTQSIKFLEESVQVMEPHFERNGDRVDQYRAQQFIIAIRDLDGKLAAVPAADAPVDEILARRNHFLDQALNKERWCTDVDSKISLLDCADARAKLDIAARQPGAAIALCSHMIDLVQKTYEEKPYYWYLRVGLGNMHRRLAETYALTGEKEKEVRAWQQWIRVSIAPSYGLSFTSLLAPDFPPTEENLKTLRGLENELPGFRTFSFNSESSGLVIPIDVSVPNSIPDAGFDPLADQARYYEEVRGLRFSKSSREAIVQMSTIAHDQERPLADLIFEGLKPNPLLKAENALAAARDAFDQRSKASEAGEKAAREAKAALADAHVEAAEQALANANGSKLVQYTEGAVAAGASGPRVQSKEWLVQWIRGEQKAALAAWRAAWADEKSVVVVRADFQRLAQSADGLNVLAAIHRGAETTAPLVSAEAGKAWKAGRSNLLDGALAALKDAEETYAKLGNRFNRRVLVLALDAAAGEAIYAQRWKDVESWLRRIDALGYNFTDSHGKLGIALIFQGKEDEALTLLRSLWVKPLSDGPFREWMNDLIASLEQAGITHPSLQKAREKLDNEAPQLRFDYHSELLAAAEKAYAEDRSEANRRYLLGELVNVADCGMFLRKFAESEAFSRRCIELDPEHATGDYGNLANALLFQGKFDAAMAIYREHWLDPWNYMVLGDSSLDDFSRLAAQHITHPDTARVIAQMSKELPEMLKKRAPRDYEAAKTRISDSEEAYAKESSDFTRSNLFEELINGSRAALLVRDWASAEKWALRSAQLAGDNSRSLLAQAQEGLAVLFQGNYDKSIALLRPAWTLPFGDTTIGGTILNDLDKLEKIGVTLPEVGRLKKALGPPKKT